MRLKPETLLIAAMSVFTAAGLVATLVTEFSGGAHDDPMFDPGAKPVVVDLAPVTVSPAPVEPTAAQAAGEWFASIRGYCNPVDVETRLRWSPAPRTAEGTMHEAACLALAGRIDRARSVIEELPQHQRHEAAGVIFGAGHPAADAGDELAAGPLMELVVEFWPNHYMALYHAGAAAYERGEHAAAERYLTAFLAEYAVEDGWRRNAEAMLDTTQGG